ncbi:MAG: response regulator [Proteobacteria bacterium]|nr:response regulator [Pseudomonadota bacterium]
MKTTLSRILSIEDDRRVRESIVAWLEDSGFEVLEASDGAKGVEVFCEQAPDLVLLDMGLPKLSGLEVLRRIHEHSPETPVVIVSANANISDAIGAFKAGAWDYVIKPILNFDVLEQTIRNCLERLALKEKVRRAEQRYKDLVQNLPVLIFTLDMDLTLRFINDTSLDILGYAPQELIGVPDLFLERIAPEDRNKVREVLEQACQQDAGFSVDFRFRHKNGYQLRLQAKSIGTGCDQNEPSEAPIKGIITDVTERIFLEKVLVQREKLNTLGAVSHELAHEIRNPLMSLGGFAKRLASKHPDIPEAEIILEQAHRLEELMNRISAYVAPVPIKTQAVNISAIMTYCLDRLTPWLVPREMDVRPRLDMSVNDIPSDPDLLTETFASILNHLIGNMEARSKLIIITSQSPSHVTAEFDLANAQTEVLPPDADTLLMPFEEGGGTLALALAYRNLKNLGGMLTFTHKEDGSAVITASLPREQASAPPTE